MTYGWPIALHPVTDWPTSDGTVSSVIPQAV